MLIEGVEPEAAAGEMVRELGVEEVVGEAVDRQHTVLCGGRLAAAADQGGEEIALAVGVGSQRDGGLLEAQQDVVRPFGVRCRHEAYLSGGVVLATRPNSSGWLGIT